MGCQCQRTSILHHLRSARQVDARFNLRDNKIMPVHVVNHPLAQHLLALLRDADTPPEQFRTLCKTLTTILVLECTRSLPSTRTRIRTPLVETNASLLSRPIAAIPILRAGLGMLDPVVEMFPSVAVGYIGLERHEATAVAKSYYCKLPDLLGTDAICLDPMLATGGSASQALSLISVRNPASMTMVCIVAAPEGAERLARDHPDVAVFIASLDEGLDEHKYIVPASATLVIGCTEPYDNPFTQMRW